jgi:hypothetical protein
MVDITLVIIVRNDGQRELGGAIVCVDRSVVGFGR